MSEMLKILHLEDSPNDAELVRYALKKADFRFELTWVSDKAAFSTALAEQSFDIVLTDYSLPDFSGVEALEAVRQRDEMLPVVLVTGAMGEEMAIESLKAGVSDYVLKTNLARLTVVVPRAIAEKKTEREHRQALRNLELSEERFDLAVRGSGAGIWDWPDVDRDDMWWSPRISQILGYGDAEIAQTISQWEMLVLEEDRSQFMTVLQRHLKNECRFDVECRMYHKNGNVVWIRNRGSVQRDAQNRPVRMAGYVQDISDRKAAEGDRQQLNEYYRAITHTANEAIVMIDTEGKVSFWNPAAVRVFGYSRDEATGVDLHQLLAPQRYHASAAEALETFFRTGTGQLVGTTVEMTAVHKDGHEFPVELSLARVSRAGEWHAVGIVRDNTERKREQDLQRAQLALIDYASSHTITELMQWFLDEAEKLTASEVGFCHFVAVDEESMALRTWSTRTLQGQCAGAVSETHYPFSKAGVWVDCVRQRRPVIHNDYSSLPHKKGLPEGHVPVVRELVVPVFRGDKIVAVLGVGNKKTDYVEADVSVVQRLADLAWETVVRKQAEESLQLALSEAEEARKRIEAMLRSVADGLVFTDMGDRVVLMSSSAEKMFGRSLAEAYLQPVSSLIADQGLSDYLHAIHRGEERGVYSFEIPGDCEQVTRVIQMKSSLVRGLEEMRSGVITLFRDISRERELDRMKSSFISTAAHELRTPLASVMGYAELLMNEKSFDGQQQVEFLSIIHDKSQVLERIIDDLLNISRVDSGRVIHVEKCWCDLSPGLTDLIKQYRLESKNHDFTLSLPSAPVTLMVDAGKIFQVLERLLVNAVKFSAEGSQIQVRYQALNDEIAIEVQDQGIGMTPEQCSRMFEQFYRADTSLTAKQGLGLGMSIVKNIIESHGGTIGVESEFGRGTTVRFTLPVGENPAR